MLLFFPNKYRSFEPLMCSEQLTGGFGRQIQNKQYSTFVDKVQDNDALLSKRREFCLLTTRPRQQLQ